MSFDKIHLPGTVLADLYPQGLVVLDSEHNTNVKSAKSEENTATPAVEMPASLPKKTPESVKPGSLAYLGHHEKKIAIIVQDAAAIHLQDHLLEILSAILSACKLNLADVAIINTHTQTVTDARLRQELGSRSIILFGVTTAAIELPFHIPDYKLQPFNDCIYLQAASLEKMQGNSNDARMEKSKLWLCLKSLFQI